jgi:hypothetical protein
MPTVQDIFNEYGPGYIEKFGDKMPKEHLKAMEAIINCRTAEYGVTVYECSECGEIHHVFRSCGNRNCPGCQHQKSAQWLNRHLELMLPGHHFLVTFTVPEELRPFIRSNQRIAYNAMFKASSETMKKLSLDEQFIGGNVPGFFGMLHTWGRQNQYHPHIHYVVPGGAFSSEDGLWHPSRIDFYLPVHAMSKIYRAKFRDLMKEADLYHLIPFRVWDMDWNVNVQAVGSAESSIRYLSPYVFKIAVSDSRIVSVENGKVTFTYFKKGSSRPRHITVEADEFIRRFLQHVLPSGFMKIRYYGFMSPNSSVSVEEIRAYIELSYGFEIQTVKPELRPVKPVYCPSCGGKLVYRYSILPYQMAPKRTPDKPAA